VSFKYRWILLLLASYLFYTFSQTRLHRFNSHFRHQQLLRCHLNIKNSQQKNLFEDRFKNSICCKKTENTTESHSYIHKSRSHPLQKRLCKEKPAYSANRVLVQITRYPLYKPPPYSGPIPCPESFQVEILQRHIIWLSQILKQGQVTNSFKRKRKADLLTSCLKP
jgi:hypothetical protein